MNNIGKEVTYLCNKKWINVGKIIHEGKDDVLILLNKNGKEALVGWEYRQQIELFRSYCGVYGANPNNRFFFLLKEDIKILSRGQTLLDNE